MSCTLLDAMDEGGDLVVDLPALLHEAGDLLDGVDDGGVIPPAELAGDGRVAEVRELAEDLHADLPGRHEGPAPAGAAELLDAEPEGVGGRLEDDLRCDPAGLAGREDVGEDALGQL